MWKREISKATAGGPGKDRGTGDPGGDLPGAAEGDPNPAQMAEDLPLIQADVEETPWVLINFLTNAIKFSTDHDRSGTGLGLSISKEFIEAMGAGSGRAGSMAGGAGLALT